MLEARASEIKHLGGWFILEQLLCLSPVKGIPEEIALVDLHVLLRKKLLRFTTGISLNPAIEVDFRSHFSIRLSMYFRFTIYFKWFD